MKCPRDGVDLQPKKLDGFQVEQCPTCRGNWLSESELPQLEAEAEPDAAWREGTVEWFERDDKMHCPVCGEEMESFDYRAEGVTLDTCKQRHGYWLDAREDQAVESAMRKRVGEVKRADRAEVKWGEFIYKLGRPSWLDRLDHFLKGSV